MMMKPFVFLFAAFAAMASLAQPAAAQDVRITIVEVQGRPGHLLGALYTEDNFLHGRGAFSAMMSPQAGTMVMEFHNVPPGTYSFSVFHDQNDDRQLQKSANGMPQEGWAFSRGGSLQGPPTFRDTSFTVGDQPVSLTVHMFYPYVPPNQ